MLKQMFIVAVAILEQRQRRFRVRYLGDSNLEFPKLEDTRLRLLVALILSYKMSTHAKDRKKPSLEKKNTETNKRTTKIKREN